MTAPGGDPSGSSGGGPSGGRPDAARSDPRPWLERIGLAAIALVMGGVLAVMAIVSWAGGEWILAAMSASGAVLTVVVAIVTVIRG
jgi:hypothetical protein